MKKVISILLMILLALSLSCCSNETVSCQNCKKDISASARYCEHCGTKTESVSSANTSSISLNEQNISSQISSADSSVQTPSSQVQSQVQSQIHIHSFSAPTCTAPAICSCGEKNGLKLEHNYINNVCSHCGKVGGTITITADNFNTYFEIVEEADWGINAFDEATDFKGIRHWIRFKDKYKNRFTADVACEYLIKTGNRYSYEFDLKNKTYKIGKIIEKYNPQEQLSTTRIQDSDGAYITSSIIVTSYIGQSKCISLTSIGKITRAQGTITYCE